MPKKDIKGYENLYQIDKDGRIYSNKSGRGASTKILSPQKGTKGYALVRLYDKDGNGKTQRVHRLVAEAFIPNTKNYPQIDHIDGDKWNNHVSNLRWVSNQENTEKENAKTFKLTFKNGSIEIVYNLLKWCRNNKFDIASLYKMAYGERKSAYGIIKMEVYHSA